MCAEKTANEKKGTRKTGRNGNMNADRRETAPRSRARRDEKDTDTHERTHLLTDPPTQIIKLTHALSLSHPNAHAHTHTNRHTHTHLNVRAFESEAKPGALVLDEVEGHLGVALLLQVRDDGLPNELGVAHHVEHLWRERGVVE